MKKFLSVSLLLVVLALITAACGGSSADDLLGDIQERGTIRVSTDANYAPQSYLDEKRQLYWL
jgi:ABC-type amino acid transport substrate-binding protein